VLYCRTEIELFSCGSAPIIWPIARTQIDFIAAQQIDRTPADKV
jgi:hypothetical protein